MFVAAVAQDVYGATGFALLAATDGRRVEPGFAVNVRAAGVGRAARRAAGGRGAQVRGAGQLRVHRNVAHTLGRLRRRATVVQVAGSIIRPLLRGVEINDAV